jgi:hypothetical protein
VIRLPLESLHGDNGPGISVDAPEGDIYLTFEAETDQDKSEYRTLTSYEARTLAAILTHYASEVER